MINVLKKLEALGFGAYEAKAYYALLRKHPANGYEISKLAQIPPSKIYETLTKLKNRGAVLDSQSDPVQYYPVQPEVLFSRLQQETEKNIQAVLSDLAVIPPMEAFELTWNLQGTDGINEKIIEVIRQAKLEVFASLWPEQLEYLQESLKEAMAKGVYVVIAVFGKSVAVANEVINLEACSGNIHRRAGAKLCTVITDNDQVVVGELAEEHGRSTGVWTSTPALVLVAKEYIKHDMMVNILVNNMEQKQYEDICRRYEIIRRMQQQK